QRTQVGRHARRPGAHPDRQGGGRDAAAGQPVEQPLPGQRQPAGSGCSTGWPAAASRPPGRRACRPTCVR
ncbi:MAG TPA: hypothetical protein VM597_26950, partial [Gemmataceae bacterium]|nr:hypothetical protein [Gemmataceae bacterium]